MIIYGHENRTVMDLEYSGWVDANFRLYLHRFQAPGIGA